MRPAADGIVRDTGLPDVVVPTAAHHAICTGYPGDIGMPPPYAPGDFAWMLRSLHWPELVHFRPAQKSLWRPWSLLWLPRPQQPSMSS